jgi:hypothetical protein
MIEVARRRAALPQAAAAAAEAVAAATAAAIAVVVAEAATGTGITADAGMVNADDEVIHGAIILAVTVADIAATAIRTRAAAAITITEGTAARAALRMTPAAADQI